MCRRPLVMVVERSPSGNPDNHHDDYDRQSQASKKQVSSRRVASCAGVVGSTSPCHRKHDAGRSGTAEMHFLLIMGFSARHAGVSCCFPHDQRWVGEHRLGVPGERHGTPAPSRQFDDGLAPDNCGSCVSPLEPVATIWLTVVVVD
jgi:hypothetical protein